MTKFIASPTVLYDPQFLPFSLMAANTQAPGNLMPDGRLCIAPNNISVLTFATIEAFIGAGGEVEGLPVFIKMTTSKYNTNVPVGISNRSYVDEQDNTIIRKWSEWKDSTHEHMDATDGDKVVPGNSYGVELTSAELAKLISLTGYTMYINHEVGAILPTDNLNI